MSNCPCCSNVLLRHIRGNEVYWFCRNCWQTMPILPEKEGYYASKVVSLESKRPIYFKQKHREVLSAV
ncbi:hypothetical protein [Calothrix sp. UHCC 0171]|uniref:hypothetical protein n=1 Tax=Calothrix sp. UHCC 0171 TaxID=3110245 RepID=UPI002B20B271|nr:hypothetical protein [Calothrix sp. UHCC 0171]MEA5573032.1 hypothetical protein [Calothrix sp. UHCC 0171]